MERRPTRWHAPPPREPAIGGGPLIVLLVIIGAILLVGLNAPSIRIESLFALFGFH